jgi:hypothetical protein
LFCCLCLFFVQSLAASNRKATIDMTFNFGYGFKGNRLGQNVRNVHGIIPYIHNKM